MTWASCDKYTFLVLNTVTSRGRGDSDATYLFVLQALKLGGQSPPADKP